MAKLSVVEDGSHFGNHHSNGRSEIHKKEGIKYCSTCGKECLVEDKCCTNDKCRKNTFLSEKNSSVIGGYVEAAKNDGIKTHFNRHFKKSSVKMNPKRMMHYILQHKERISIKEELINKIYNSNISQR